MILISQFSYDDYYFLFDWFIIIIIIDYRNRGLVQYFSPYLSADLFKMAESFNTNVANLEDELMKLILDGSIQVKQIKD